MHRLSLKLDGVETDPTTWFGPEPSYPYARQPLAFSRFDLERPVEVEIGHPDGMPLSLTCRPPIDPVREPGLLRFRMESPGHVIAWAENTAPLLLSADPAEQWLPPEDALVATEHGVRADCAELQCSAINTLLKELSESGGGTLHLPPGTYPVSTIVMQSDVTLHLDAGATLQATTDIDAYPVDPDGVLFEDLPPSLIPGPRRRVIYWHDCENAALTGRGMVAGQGSKIRHHFNSRGIQRPLINLMKFVHTRRCRIEGVTLADSEFWNTHVLLSQNIVFDSVKIINERPPVGWACPYFGERARNWFWNNTDGINPDSSQNIEIRNCLFHTGDDCVAVKNTGTYRNEIRDVRDIRVHDNVMLCGTTPMKIGTETRGGLAEHIHFHDNAVARCSRMFAAELKDGITVRDLIVENITIGECNRPFDLEIMRRQDEENQKTFSNLDGAVLRNIRIDRYRTEGQWWQCHIRGHDRDHAIRSVRLETITLGGQPLDSLDHEDLILNDFTEDITCH